MMEITYLRVSVTDKCNLKCFYCRPEGFEFFEKEKLLSFEEITRFVKALTKYGLKRVRLTGGEPLLRKDLHLLIRMLRDIPQIEDISLTTNGITLAKYAKQLKENGLNRVNVSIDSLKPELFYEMTKGNLHDVLEGIKEAKRVGLEPIKVNAVVIRGVNEDEALDFVEFAKEYGVEVRFIEMMPLGQGQIHWELDMVKPLDLIRQNIEKKYGKLKPTESIGSGAARVYELESLGVKIGFITPISNPFCDGCSKLRLTAEGSVKLCLRTDEEIPVKDILRHGTDKELDEFIKYVLIEKERSNAEIQKSNYAFSECRRVMTSIGG